MLAASATVKAAKARLEKKFTQRGRGWGLRLKTGQDRPRPVWTKRPARHVRHNRFIDAKGVTVAHKLNSPFMLRKLQRDGFVCPVTNPTF